LSLDVEPITIGDMLRASAARHGAASALEELSFAGDIERRWTYQELLHDSERLARALASRVRASPSGRPTVPNG